MHPGNLFAGTDGNYIAVDFGIVGSLTTADQRYLAENFLAFFKRDYRQVAEAHLRAGWVPKEVNIEELETAIRAVCEPILNKPLAEISLAQVLLQLLQIARRFDMEVQPQLVLLQKTILNIEGIGRQLNPEFDLWKTGKPFFERWVKENLGIGALTRELLHKLPHWSHQLPELPDQLLTLIRRAEQGELELRWRSSELEQLPGRLAQMGRQLVSAIVAGSLLVSAALLYALNQTPSGPAGIPTGSYLCGGAALLILLFSHLRQPK